MTELTLAKALGSGLRRALADDDRVVLMGEDIGTLGGVFRVTDGLQRDFGRDRVMDTPLAESGIVGTAVGLAFRGYRPVVEIQFDGFIYPGFDQIVAQVAAAEPGDCHCARLLDRYKSRGTIGEDWREWIGR